MRRITFVFLLLALLTGGCQLLNSPEAANPLPDPARLTLKPCKVAGETISAECGSFSVPEDRANPNGLTLDLGLVVVRAQGPDRQPDPLFILTGGPGGFATGTDVVNGVSNWFKRINQNRDVIFIDQRGTNGKHRLECQAIPFAVRDATQQQVDDWVKGCLSVLHGDPRFFTTAEAMRDLDEARAALGYDKINLYGASYGAAAAQVYMRMFPKKVRAAVLDHGTAIDLPFFQQLPRVSQSALDQIFTYCEQDEQCRTAYPDVRAEWQAILARLAAGPVVTRWTPPGADAPAQMTLDDLVNGAHLRMYQTDGYTAIPSIIHTLASNQDWTQIVKSLNEQTDSNSSTDGFLLMRNIIFCFEPAWGNLPDQVARFADGSYYKDVAIRSAQDLQKICAALPKPDPSLIYPPGKPLPLSALMLNSLIDPQNPPSNMEPALKEFTKSRIVVEPTEGHNTSFLGCRWDIIADYIQAGSVDGLDVSCMEKVKPEFLVVR